ncbi:hypothetical protein AB0K00_08990 [Dactylosporangium sp. NPDC049525]|uniref:hypothetical protein n=1 Tax=Dactylosporangium sp. NPDC049525 TaxID=3154730 RepID=UPI003435F66B
MAFVVPDACTLPTAERPLRLGEFDDLFAAAVRQVELISPTHARMRLSGAAGLEATVRDLTAREAACCSFFTFTVTPQPPQPPQHPEPPQPREPAEDGAVVTLDIAVPDRYADVLASLAERAGAAAAGRASHAPAR